MEAVSDGGWLRGRVTLGRFGGEICYVVVYKWRMEERLRLQIARSLDIWTGALFACMSSEQPRDMGSVRL